MTALIRQLDRVAILLSGVCVLHCLLAPVAITLLPLLTLGLGGEEHFHELMLWVVLPVSTLGLALGWRQHRRGEILLLGAASMALLTFAATWGHHHLPHAMEALLTVIGSLALAAAHVLNFRLLRHRRAGALQPS
jgi:cytochrome c biogenesis factor